MAIGHGDKSKETKKTFDDITSKIFFIQKKEKLIDEIISKYKYAKGGGVNAWRTKKEDGIEWIVKYKMPNDTNYKKVKGFETEKEAREWAKNKIGIEKSIILEATDFEINRTEKSKKVVKKLKKKK